MEVKDLKQGDRITLRNGEVVFWGESNADLKDYKNDLTDDTYDFLDIVKVERIQIDNELYTIDFDVNLINIKEFINNNLIYEIIWERK